MTKQVKYFFFEALRRAVCGGEKCDPGVLSEEEIRELYTLSKAHDLAHLICFSCGWERSSDGAVPEAREHFKKQYDLSVMRHVRRGAAIEGLRTVLGGAGVPFILLKGSALLDLYPEPWMRTSSDVDVLVREEDLDRAAEALIKAGYGMMCSTAHDVSYKSPERYHIELHHTLLESFRRPATAGVLEDVWSYADRTEENGFEYVLRDEMFYYYHVAHMVKHFEGGGCGVRSLLDLWLLDHRRTAYDARKRDELLKKGEILTFARYARELAEEWFSNKPHDRALDDFESYILSGGVYGTIGQAALTRRSKTGKKGLRYKLSRLFLPVGQMKGRYPILQRRPILLPWYYLKRLFKLLNPATRKRARAEVAAVDSDGEDKVNRTKALLAQLEII